MHREDHCCSTRDSRNPRLRGLLRGMMRKHGVLSVRPLVEGSKAGRHKSLMKLKQPLRQIQGHKLLALRSAQKDRVLSTRITLDQERGMQKVLLSLGKKLNPAFEGVHRVVAARALDRRLLPMLEEEIRLELKERADEEALRFLGQHLRRVLLAEIHTRKSPTAGFLVDPKGSWVIAIVDADGQPMGDALTVEIGERSLEEIATDLEPLREHKVEAIALGNGKTSRSAVQKPDAPSPKAKSGAMVSPRLFRLRRGPRQLSTFSRNPSMIPRTSFSAYSSALIITNIDKRS